MRSSEAPTERTAAQESQALVPRCQKQHCQAIAWPGASGPSTRREHFVLSTNRWTHSVAGSDGTQNPSRAHRNVLCPHAHVQHSPGNVCASTFAAAAFATVRCAGRRIRALCLRNRCDCKLQRHSLRVCETSRLLAAYGLNAYRG